MYKRHAIPVNRADLLKLLGKKDDKELRVSAPLVGFEPPDEEPSDNVDLTLPDLPDAPPEKNPKEQQSSEPEQLLYQRVIDRRPSVALPEPDANTGLYSKPDFYLEVPLPDPDQIKANTDIGVPQTEHLVPWTLLWPCLQTFLAETKKSSRPDIPLLVDCVARAELVETIPRQKKSGWCNSLTILVDSSSRLRPFKNDINQLIRRLELLRGELGFSVQTIVDRPGGRVEVFKGDKLEIKPWSRPSPSTTILILSDLGIYSQSKKLKERWQDFGTSLKLAGCMALVLLPVPAQWIPRDLTELFDCISWDRRSNLRPIVGGCTHIDNNADIHKDDTAVEDLLAWLSPVVRVEPFLLRAVRHLLGQNGLHVGHEALAWNHKEVEPTPLGFTYYGENIEWFRQRFKTLTVRYPELSRDIARLIIDSHRHLNPTIRYEEILILAELMGDLLGEQIQLLAEEGRAFTAGLLKLMLEKKEECGGLKSFMRLQLKRQHKELLTSTPAYQAVWAVLSAGQAGDSSPLIIPEGWDKKVVLPFLQKHLNAEPTNYLLLSHGKLKLRVVEETLYKRQCDLLQTGALLTSFQTHSGLIGIDKEEGVSIEPIGEERVLSCKPQSPVSLHLGGEQIRIESFEKPEWAYGISVDVNGVTVQSRDDTREYELYWNPPVVADPGLKTTLGEHIVTKETLTLPGCWYPELIGDQISPSLPPWSRACIRDQFGIAALVEIKGVEFWLRWVQPTHFQMGSPESEKARLKDERLHTVQLTSGYWLAETTCTQKLWSAVMGKNPSRFEGENLPVERVSWNNVLEFIERINSIVPALNLQLPTEAQWENGCRAGTQTPFQFGMDADLKEMNYSGKDELELADRFEDGAIQKTERVKTYFPNEWGLYQMHGNVWEWCADRYAAYPDGITVNPTGPAKSAVRVLRGGSWDFSGRDCRSAARSRIGPTNRINFIGFRLAQGQEPVQEVKKEWRTPERAGGRP